MMIWVSELPYYIEFEFESWYEKVRLLFTMNYIYYILRVCILPSLTDSHSYKYVNLKETLFQGYFSSKDYIAYQGPVSKRPIDFWALVWEKTVPIIIMLSDDIGKVRR